LSIPLERIEDKARQADPRKVALTVLLFIPFVLGWGARKTWMTLVYLCSALVAGWQEAGRPRTSVARPGEDAPA
jgi:hypothetical protein